MKDEKKEKTDVKKPETSFKEIDIPAEEPDLPEEKAVDEDKDFGLHPAEYEAEIVEIERQRKSKLPVFEKDVLIQTRNINLERIDDE